MCGICGAYSFSGDPGSLLRIVRKMQDVQRHRGPDAEGVSSVGSAVLGSTRLKILDLSDSANQPFSSADGKVTLVYNGEIYNYAELRDRKVDGGFVFRTTGDTEVLAELFADEREACLDDLNGMFAFAAFEHDTASLVIVRDRFGVKPLYYYADPGHLVFASELKALMEDPAIPRVPDNQVIYDYLLMNALDYSERTFLSGVKRLLPGHMLVASGDGVLVRRWYDFRRRAQSTPLEGAESNPDRLRHLLEDAVRLRLRSDVPVGCCLSGGLDSNSIVSIMSRSAAASKPVHSFSAVYDSSFQHDEGEIIRKSVSDNHLNPSYTTPDASQLAARLVEFVRCQDEPVGGTSVFAHFGVMALAVSTKTTVILDGQGGDESLGGYHYFFAFRWRELLRGGHFASFVRDFFLYVTRHPDLTALRYLPVVSMPPGVIFKGLGMRRRHVRLPDGADPLRSFQYFRDVFSPSSFDEARFSHFEQKLEHLLRYEDRNSMHFSLETRLPFLDFRIAEFLLSLGAEQLLRDGTTKWLLREAMGGQIPEVIRTNQRKIGFETDESEWLRSNEIARAFGALVLDGRPRSAPYLDSKRIAKMYEGHRKRRANHGQELWKALNLEVWLRLFIEGQSVEEVQHSIDAAPATVGASAA